MFDPSERPRTDLEDLLASLVPARSVSRAETLFAAGRARGRAESERNRPAAWPWQLATGVLAVALVAVSVGRHDTHVSDSRNPPPRENVATRGARSPRHAEKRAPKTHRAAPSVTARREDPDERAGLERNKHALVLRGNTFYPLDGDLRSWLLDGTDLPPPIPPQGKMPETIDPAGARAGIAPGDDVPLPLPVWFTFLRTWTEGASP